MASGWNTFFAIRILFFRVMGLVAPNEIIYLILSQGYARRLSWSYQVAVN